MSRQCYCGDCWRCGVDYYTDSRPMWSDHFDNDLEAGNETDFITKSDLIANISRGEEALKGIEPGAVFDIEDLFPTQ